MANTYTGPAEFIVHGTRIRHGVALKVATGENGEATWGGRLGDWERAAWGGTDEVFPIRLGPGKTGPGGTGKVRLEDGDRLVGVGPPPAPLG
jgi:hypothetical protein